MGFAPQRQIAIGFNSIRASDSWCRCRKRNYAMSIKRLFDTQQNRAMRRIGVLATYPADDVEGHARLTAFAQPCSLRRRPAPTITGQRSQAARKVASAN